MRRPDEARLIALLDQLQRFNAEADGISFSALADHQPDPRRDTWTVGDEVAALSYAVRHPTELDKLLAYAADAADAARHVYGEGQPKCRCYRCSGRTPR